MCTVLLPSDVNPIAVNKYITSYHFGNLSGRDHLGYINVDRIILKWKYMNCYLVMIIGL